MRSSWTNAFSDQYRKQDDTSRMASTPELEFRQVMDIRSQARNFAAVSTSYIDRGLALQIEGTATQLSHDVFRRTAARYDLQTLQKESMLLMQRSYTISQGHSRAPSANLNKNSIQAAAIGAQLAQTIQADVQMDLPHQ